LSPSSSKSDRQSVATLLPTSEYSDDDDELDPLSSSLPSSVGEGTRTFAAAGSASRGDDTREHTASELRGVFTGVNVFRNGLLGDTQYDSAVLNSDDDPYPPTLSA
jgi:hypothetical protein